jgi:hypothetical protein
MIKDSRAEYYSKKYTKAKNRINLTGLSRTALTIYNPDFKKLTKKKKKKMNSQHTQYDRFSFMLIQNYTIH